jgi:1-deoxy-D-xylulose-5-phosphate reductoisomerase
MVGMTGISASPIKLALLGSTGSIGRQTLDVVRASPDRFHVVALAAGHNVRLLEEQAREFRPQIVAATDQSDLDVPAGVRIADPANGLVECATWDSADVVLVATSGIASISATIAAAELGRTIALANKEALVCGASLLLPAVARGGGELRPVDSEHSAIWQCLGTLQRPDVCRLTLTASGGPFRSFPAAGLEHVTIADALNHPTWAMGKKISIDSATLVNKGLEAIEAHHLFGISFDNIDVVIHPESIVHSLVEFMDGSTLAQLSHPDMRLPIQYALTHPEHHERERQHLDLASIGTLTFERPDNDRFPALRLCFEAGRSGITRSIALCTADELAVEAFLAGRLRFTDIPRIIEKTVAQMPDADIKTIADLEDAVSQAEQSASALLARSA